jgi:hypothetical protein
VTVTPAPGLGSDLVTVTDAVVLTVMDTVATLEVVTPSFARYVKLSVPWNDGAGVYVKPPFAARVAVPWPAGVTIAAVSVPPLGALSLLRTPGAAIVRLVPCTMT